MFKQFARDALALDGLIRDAVAYRNSAELRELLDFIRRFRRMAPFNACLLHIQKPGSTYVATAEEWRKEFWRDIKPGARPLVILWPFGPVRFVYDVTETDGAPLPERLEMPFRMNGHIDEHHYQNLLDNLRQDGIFYREADLGANAAGHIQKRPEEEAYFGRHGDFRYWLIVNRDLWEEERAATIFHELAHLYCGHLGKEEGDFWPDRRGLSRATCEFEAESVTYLLCGRLGFDNPSSAEFVSMLLDANNLPPDYSLEQVIRVTHRIESMLERVLPKRERG